MKTTVHATLLAVSLLLWTANHAAAQSTAFAYRGSLSESNALANGAYEFRFELFGQASEGVAAAGPVTNSPVTVSNGLFTVQLDFGAAPFDGGDRWLELGVRKIATGAFSTLQPRQQITPLPYAITASKVTGPLPTSGLSGAYTNPVTLNNPANVFVGNGSGLAGISSTTLGGLTAAEFWQRGGNAGTTPGTHFLGTADNQALELKVNNARALRLEPGAGSVPNLIVGAAGNTISPGVIGATIAGGQDHAIRSNAAHAFIGGGRNNKIETNSAKAVITGGEGNLIEANADHATIGGGQANGIFASSRFAVIAGGTGNIIFTNSNFGAVGGGSGNRLDALSQYSTIAGGQSGYIQGANWAAIGGGAQQKIRSSANATIAGGGYNEIGTNATYSTVGGGFFNRVLTNASFGVVGGGRESKVTGEYGTIPGGYLNEAAAHSFAAGRQAKATNNGAFVWADSLGADFASTTNNQFSVRASGGVRFVTGGAGVTVDGVPLGGAGTSDGSALTNLNASALGFGTVSDTRLSANVALLGSSATFNGNLAATGDVLGQRLKVGEGHGLSGNLATISGGQNNTNQANWAVISGGRQNQIHASSSYSVLVGGDNNRIRSNTIAASVGGGAEHEIGSLADYASISGGQFNQNFSPFAAIGGGGGNRISTVSPGATVGGGLENGIGTNAGAATISGGYSNLISADASFGAHPVYSTIGGGAHNVVRSWGASVGGGSNNIIGYSGRYGAINGGRDNQLSSEGSSIGGGGGNVFAGLGGGGAIYGVISGGWKNFVHFGADYSTIAGGAYNAVDLPSAPFGASAYTAIGGGLSNRVNDAYGSIGGGRGNTASAFASIPGGTANVATNYAFAAGNRAKANHEGAFVWADSQEADFPSTADNQFLIRASGGVGIGATNLTGALYLRHPVGAPAAGMNPQDNGLGLGQHSTSGYKWIQSYGGALALNPVANNVGIGTTNPTTRLQVVNATCDGNNWVNSSDRNLKENFRQVDAQQVLEKVAGLTIQEWNYKSTPGQSHVGPVAQDFHAAFRLGNDDKHIATVDADGVALAAIQGLNQKVEAQRSQLAERETEIVELKRQNAQLARRLEALEQRLQ